MLGQEVVEQAKALGIPVHFSEKIGSTNDWAKETKTDSPSLFTCNQQTAGRGRYSRSWTDSEQGGQVFISYSMFLKEAPHFLLAPLIGLQIKDFLKNTFPQDTSYQLKLPNDIYLNRKKLCGILCEMQQQNNQYRLIIGLGINLFTHPNLENSGAILKEKSSLPENFVEELTGAIQNCDFHLEKLKPNVAFTKDVVLQMDEAVVDVSSEFDFISNQRVINWRDL